MKVEVKYSIEFPSENLGYAVYRALVPDVKNVPEVCKADISVEGKRLVLTMNCSSISKLRALNNSFIGVLALLLRVVGDVENVYWKATGENSPT
ncbi:MAG: KEOPS complex subunit Pcc1 [Desulfurococcaceae archaeon]